jgi:hypothetical protein
MRMVKPFSFIICLAFLGGCGSDTPTGPTTDFIAIESMVPAAGTTLVPGERVTFTAVLTCTIVSADGGVTAMVLQDQRNQSLLGFDERSPQVELRRGTETVTLSHTITVPPSGNTVNALFPIFINGSDSTRAIAVRTYSVR